MKLDFDGISRLLQAAHAEGRDHLFEHECYQLLETMGAEAAPTWRLIPADRLPTAADLAAIPGERVVLKIVSPDITHKTEAHGVRVVANDLAAVQTAFRRMLDEVPPAYARYLEGHGHGLPAPLVGLAGAELERTLSSRIRGILICRFVTADAAGFATELFVGLRATSEFGPVLSAGVGGVEMEILASRARPGAAVSLAPTGLVDGERFLELFRGTLSYQRLAGAMRGSERLVDDDALLECFSSFIALANHFSEVNPEAPFHLREMEVNPFQVAGGRIAPLDGVCSFCPAVSAPAPRPLAAIGHLLRPHSAAVIGVSEKSMNMGRIILNNLFDAGFDREHTWVVRPGCEAVDGARCVATVADLPGRVDLFVVAVGAAQVPGLVDELIDHDRARAVILIPGGLGEKEGSQELERDLKEKIQAAHTRGDGGPVFLGGNSLGVISHPGHYDTMFIPEAKLAKSRGERQRKACFLSQSGAFIISNLSRMPWLDPAYALSIGNQIDLTAGDLMHYLAEEPDLELFAAYMEGFQPGDGLAFARAVRTAIARGREVVFYKAGRTSEGRSATAGHTASVAGDYAVCEAALREAGALVADHFDEFSDLLRLSLRLRGKQLGGTRIAAMSNAGFEAVGMADSLRRPGAELTLAGLGPATSARLRERLAAHRLDGLVDVKNPFDVTPMANDSAYAELVAEILADPGVDAVVAGIVPLTPAMQTLPAGRVPHEDVDSPDSIAVKLPAVARESAKPVVAVVDSGTWFDALAERLEDGGIPVFRAADRAVRALGKLLNARAERKPAR